jgi:copper transport protein
VLGSTFGAVMLVRLGVVTAAAFLLRPLLTGPGGGESRLDLALLGVLGVAALATWPLTGHPTASPVAGVSVVIDALHLGAVAVWVGGLVMLLGFLLPRANGRELGAILPIWSRWAMAAVGALIFAGVVQSLIEVSNIDGLINSTYGRMILAKIGLAAVVIGIAAFSRKLVNSRAAEDSPGPLRKIVMAELAIIAVILGVTSPEHDLRDAHQPEHVAAGQRLPGQGRKQFDSSVRLHARQQAAAGRRVEGDRVAAGQGHRGDRDPAAADHRLPRHR